MLRVDAHLTIPDAEIELQAIRAQGAGGQNVNKVSSAIHLRFDIRTSSLPEECKSRLLAYPDQRISAEGVVVIKAQRFRSLEHNRQDALERLRELIVAATVVHKRRIPTRQSRATRERRLASKQQRSIVKSTRRKPGPEEG